MEILERLIPSEILFIGPLMDLLTHKIYAVVAIEAYNGILTKESIFAGNLRLVLYHKPQNLWKVIKFAKH